MDPLYNAFDGNIVLTGYAPDGDSVRFLPNDPSALGVLRRASLIRTSPLNGSVQMRLEGIDAPELHYQSSSQPQGSSARDALLGWLGVDAVRDGIAFLPDGATISSPAPVGVPVTVLANAVEPHGRIIAYVLPPRRGRTRPKRCRVSESVLRATANYALVQSGKAYSLAYTSLPAAHREVLRAAARAARAKKLGVWKDDATMRGFALTGGQRSIGPGGALIFPKLFRRCVDYLADRRVGFGGTFLEWLRGHGSNGEPKPDLVTVKYAANILLSSVMKERGGRISLSVDVTDLLFVEA